MIRMEASHLSISSLDTNETVELIDGVSSFFESRVKKETISETEDEEKIDRYRFQKVRMYALESRQNSHQSLQLTLFLDQCLDRQ